MPFTPFHMGVAMVIKPAATTRFSLIAFGLAQIIIDIEPGIGMLRGLSVLHGPSHTVIGAILVAGLVYLITPWCSRAILNRWNQELRFHKIEWLVESSKVGSSAIAFGALFGTLSHVFLDSLMHDDIHPFAPFSDANPLLHLMSHDAVYEWCIVGGVAGTLAWLWRKRDAYLKRAKS